MEAFRFSLFFFISYFFLTFSLFLSLAFTDADHRNGRRQKQRCRTDRSSFQRRTAAALGNGQREGAAHAFAVHRDHDVVRLLADRGGIHFLHHDVFAGQADCLRRAVGIGDRHFVLGRIERAAHFDGAFTRDAADAAGDRDIDRLDDGLEFVAFRILAAREGDGDGGGARLHTDHDAAAVDGDHAFIRALVREGTRRGIHGNAHRADLRRRVHADLHRLADREVGVLDVDLPQAARAVVAVAIVGVILGEIAFLHEVALRLGGVAHIEVDGHARFKGDLVALVVDGDDLARVLIHAVAHGTRCAHRTDHDEDVGAQLPQSDRPVVFRVLEDGAVRALVHDIVCHFGQNVVADAARHVVRVGGVAVHADHHVTVPGAALVTLVVDVVTADADRIERADLFVFEDLHFDGVRTAGEIVLNGNGLFACCGVVDLGILDLRLDNVDSDDDAVGQRVLCLQLEAALFDDSLPDRGRFIRRGDRDHILFKGVDHLEVGNIFRGDGRHDDVHRLRFEVAVPDGNGHLAVRQTRHVAERVDSGDGRIADGILIICRNVVCIGDLDLEALPDLDLGVVCRGDAEFFGFYQRNERRAVIYEGNIFLHCFRFEDTEARLDGENAALGDGVCIDVGLRAGFMDEQARDPAIDANTPHVADLAVGINEGQIRQDGIGIVIVVVAEVRRIGGSGVDDGILFAADAVRRRDRFDLEIRQGRQISVGHLAILHPAYAVAGIGELFRVEVDQTVLVFDLQAGGNDELIAGLRSRFAGIAGTVEVEGELAAPLIDVRAGKRLAAAHDLDQAEHGRAVREAALVVVLQVGRDADFRLAVPIPCRNGRREGELGRRRTRLDPDSAVVRPAECLFRLIEVVFLIGDLQARVDAENVALLRGQARVVGTIEVESEFTVPFINVRAGERRLSARDLHFAEHGSIVSKLRLIEVL